MPAKFERHFVDYTITKLSPTTASVVRDDSSMLMGYLSKSDEGWLCQKPYVSVRKTLAGAARALVERWDNIIWNEDYAHDLAIKEDNWRNEKRNNAIARANRQRLQDEEDTRDRVTKPMLTLTRRSWDPTKPDDPYEVVLYGNGARHGRVSLHVSYPWNKDYTKQLTPVCSVNWSAFGDVTPERAREYALAILYAAQVADTFNRKGAVNATVSE